jgi:hypothetical protein
MKALLEEVSREYWDALQLAKRIVAKDDLLGPDDSRALATHLHIEAAKRTFRLEREAKQEKQAAVRRQRDAADPLEAEAMKLAFGGLDPQCPKCGGAMWDNREGKKNPKSPDFKCKDENCKTGEYQTGLWLDRYRDQVMKNGPPDEAGVEQEFSNEALQPADDLPF